MNFPLSTAFKVSNKYGDTVHSFSFNFLKPLISLIFFFDPGVIQLSTTMQSSVCKYCYVTNSTVQFSELEIKIDTNFHMDVLAME